jgi:hypothetical protein
MSHPSPAGEGPEVRFPARPGFNLRNTCTCRRCKCLRYPGNLWFRHLFLPYVACQVALDEAWKDCQWPERLREQIEEYHIMDFLKWKDEEEFGRKFEKLIQGLDIFYREK